MANAHWESRDFALPRLEDGHWRRFVDTGYAGDEAILEPESLRSVEDPSRYHLESRSIVVLVSGGGGQ
jgi:hypothetical protein